MSVRHKRRLRKNNWNNKKSGWNHRETTKKLISKSLSEKYKRGELIIPDNSVQRCSVICKQCNKEIFVTRKEIQAGRQFCSKTCFNTFRSMYYKPWNYNKTGIYSVESLHKMSQKKKTNWKTSQYIKSQMKARGVKCNKKEQYLKTVLHKIFPNTYRFVGDGKVIIGTKCPDFIRRDNKKIIELYGDYWHRNDNPDDRIQYFKEYGYDTLVLWEHELKDINSISNKIILFNSI